MIDVFLDFETYYDQVYSLRQMTNQQYVYDDRFQATAVAIALDDGPVTVYPHDEVADALHAVPWDDANLVCHHTHFDGSVLAWRYGIRPRFYSCTMSMAKGLLGSLVGSVSLDALSSLVGHTKDTQALVNMKGVRGEDMDDHPDLKARFLQYAGGDVKTCRALYRMFLKKLPPKERIIIHLLHRMYFEAAFEVDQDMLVQAIQEEKIEQAQMLAAAGIADVKDLRSRDKFAALLESQGVTPPMKVSESTGKLTYAFSKKDTEFVLLQDHENPRVGALVEAKLNASSTIGLTRAQRFLETAQLTDATGTPMNRLHVPLLYSGARTHRFSGKDNLNFQNMPHGGAIRHSLKAPKGKRLVVADASQIEARLVAWLAQQADLLDAFANERDTYAEFASIVYGRPINKKDDPVERFVGKTGVLGLGYGAGWRKFHFMLVTSKDGWEGSEEEAERIVKTYRGTYRGIPKLWKRMEGMLHTLWRGDAATLGPLEFRDNQVVLPSGLSLMFPKLLASYEEGQISPDFEYYNPRYKGMTKIYGAKLLENCCQALARIQITDAMLKMHATNPEWLCLLQVHDDLCYLVDEDEADDALDHLIRFISSEPPWAKDQFALPLSLAAEGGHGDTYATAK